MTYRTPPTPWTYCAYAVFAFGLTALCIACDSVEQVIPQQEIFRVESNRDGSRTIVKLSERLGNRETTATIYHNSTMIGDFCVRYTAPGVTDSLYTHTLATWQPGDRIWADVWQPEPDGVAEQEMILK